jgi:hypothetical protein
MTIKELVEAKEAERKAQPAAPATHIATPIMLRFNDLKARGVVNNWVTLLSWIEKQGFPPGRLLGPNTRAWTDQEVAEWIASRPTPFKEVELTDAHISRRRKVEAA